MNLRPGTPEEAGMLRKQIELARCRAREWVEQGITPALVVVAARRGIIVLHEAFGRLTPAPDSPPVALDTLFPISSMVKPLVATAVMILVEEGLVGLNRPVQEYIPEVAGEDKEKVMVHHLLTHTSGMSTEVLDVHAEAKKGAAEIPPPDPNQHPYVHETLFLRYDAPLSQQPGEEMSYCDHGFRLLGEIVRRVSGRHHSDFIKERIFEPLGMRDSYFVVPEDVRDRVVKRPPDAADAMLDDPFGYDIPSASGGPNLSTAMDMAIFGQMFLNGGSYAGKRILSPASVAEMTRNQIPGISARFKKEVFPEASWGLGWSIHGNKRGLCGALNSAAAFEHWGAGGVYLWVDPVGEIVGAYFSVAISTQEMESLAGEMPWWRNDLFTDMVTAAAE
jgi:serine-type D-Ala-D-Ala carboxypeptidase